MNNPQPVIFMLDTPTFIEFAPFIESADSWKYPLAPSPLHRGCKSNLLVSGTF